MKPLLILLLFVTSLSAQTKPNACPDRTEMQGEIADTKTFILGMQSRIQMMRNYAGTVQNPEIRNALQVNAESWQDLISLLHNNVGRLQAILDRCEAREKTEKSNPK
jgi:hypothetical protein